jgi:thymidylate synthase (FAD)
MNQKFDISDFFHTLSVLDKGHVELCDGMFCDPKLKIVNAARVSYGKQSLDLTDKDIKLINFLYQHEHFSTFRHSFFTFRIKAPLIVFRQWWKHQIGCAWVENENIGTIELPDTSWNEISYRYTEFKADFYIPEFLRFQSKNNKQGSEGKISHLNNDEDPIFYFQESCQLMFERYQYLIQCGVAKEQARMLLPQNIYSECMWSPSLQSLLYFLRQRLNIGAQSEIREYAKAIGALIMPILRPLEIVTEFDEREQNVI